jgi:hypothetical protein
MTIDPLLEPWTYGGITIDRRAPIVSTEPYVGEYPEPEGEWELRCAADEEDYLLGLG